jgi:hypothetical protein
MSEIDVNSLNNVLGHVQDQINTVIDQVSTVQSQVGKVSSDVATMHGDLKELREAFEEFTRVAERTANVQRSETKLGTLKDDLDREYGHYAVVRRSSIGTLQAFDLGNVSDKTVQQVSEELMIQTPRYWLAPALVGLAAWSRDNRSLADKSIEAAFARDKAKTSLFFALVLRRQGRLDSAARWLRHYFTSLDPRALSREFGVVLETVAQDGFGPAGRDLVVTQLSDWSEQLRQDPEIVADQVSKWVAEISVQRGVVDSTVYPRLTEFSPEWPQVKELLERSSALGNMTTKYKTILDAVHPPILGLEDQMDDLLETLVTEYDAEELPLRREIVYHEAVLESNGDLDRAREARDAAIQALDETLDAVSLTTHAALHPELLGIGVQTQKIAIGASRPDFECGAGEYSSEYRKQYLHDVRVELGPTHSNYASTLGFKSWTESTATAEDKAEESLSRAWDMVVAEYIQKVRFKSTSFIVPSLITVGAALFGLLFGPIGVVVCFLVAGGICALFVWNKKRKADAAVLAAENSRDRAKAVSIDIFHEATAEWVDARLTYDEQDANEKGLIALIDSWPTLQLDAKMKAVAK